MDDNYAPGSLDRVYKLVMELLESNDKIPKPYKPIIKNLIVGFMRKLDDATVNEMIVELRDEIVPFILYGKH